MKTTALIINIAWILFFFPICAMALMSPMLFDAPGAANNKLLKFIFYCIIALPILILITQVLSWNKYSNGNYLLSLRISLIPLIDVILLAILFYINGPELSK
ncbi:MAG TPA: hypothetical protein PKM51_01795 [Chitinophagales bacterium]|nr:hypothetical protein [Chitinophagales bacterium]